MPRQRSNSYMCNVSPELLPQREALGVYCFFSPSIKLLIYQFICVSNLCVVGTIKAGYGTLGGLDLLSLAIVLPRASVPFYNTLTQRPCANMTNEKGSALMPQMMGTRRVCSNPWH